MHCPAKYANYGLDLLHFISYYLSHTLSFVIFSTHTFNNQQLSEQLEMPELEPLLIVRVHSLLLRSKVYVSL